MITTVKTNNSVTTQIIIGAFHKVYNSLGFGLVEKVYVNSLLRELKQRGLKCDTKHQIAVFYDDQEVGLYLADIIVNDCIIIEVIANEKIRKACENQLVDYLNFSDIDTGLILNFGKKAASRRKVLTSKNVNYRHEN